jgi:hypothetical protein
VGDLPGRIMYWRTLYRRRAWRINGVPANRRNWGTDGGLRASTALVPFPVRLADESSHPRLRSCSVRRFSHSRTDVVPSRCSVGRGFPTRPPSCARNFPAAPRPVRPYRRSERSDRPTGCLMIGPRPGGKDLTRSSPRSGRQGGPRARADRPTRPCPSSFGTVRFEIRCLKGIRDCALALRHRRHKNVVCPHLTRDGARTKSGTGQARNLAGSDQRVGFWPSSSAGISRPRSRARSGRR